MFRVHFEQSHPGVWDIRTADPTPTVLVTVGLHPDEAGGIYSTLVSLVHALLLRGRVIFVHCFPDEPPERLVGPEKRDPNRSFTPEVLDQGDDPFRARMRLLARLVEEADVVVDLHRYTKADGGAVAFPYDERGVSLAASADIPMIVSGLVSSVEGAFSLYAARQGKLPLVVEVGSREHERASDRNAIATLLGVLRAYRMVSEEDRVAAATGWPDGPKAFRLLRPLMRSELSEDLLDQIAALGHMAPLPPLLVEETGLPPTARLLMVNPDADPPAYACLPASEE